MLYTTMIMTFTVGVDLGFVLGCFLLIFYHIASMNKRGGVGGEFLVKKIVSFSWGVSFRFFGLC